jgi:hypothetical protein
MPKIGTVGVGRNPYFARPGSNGHRTSRPGLLHPAVRADLDGSEIDRK